MTRAAMLALVLLVALAALLGGDAAALEGFRCSHTAQCTTSLGEVCVADSLTSDRGTCRKLRILP
jgi:hypothetical protein